MKNSHPLDTGSKGILAQAGLKATPARIFVLDLLHKTRKPLSIQKIFSSLHSSEIDQVTIYRTINTLLEKNILHQIDFGHGHAHFELTSPTHHHHAICIICGKVTDISKCNIQKLEEEVKKMANFKTVKKHSLEFFGICRRCSTKKTA